jgi:hypothetical protein
LHDPSVPQVATPWSAHSLFASCPAGTDAQVPAVPIRAHDTQVPAHAVEQHTPCAQTLCAHWPAIVQGWPSASLPQLMLTQLLGDTQSVAAVVQVVLQAVAEAHW